MKRLFLSLFFSSLGLLLFAQGQDSVPVLRKFVVADMETRVPVRDARIITDTGWRDTTNYRGVCELPAHFDTLIVYKPNYLSEKLAFKDVKDTTYLLPNSHRIGEVTVWGKDREDALRENVDRWTNRAAQEGAAEAPKGILSFDFANFLDKRGRHDKKQLRKTRKAFSNLDRKGNEDPIEAAYNKVLDEKRLEAQRKELIENSLKAKAKQKEEDAQNHIASYEKAAAGPDSTLEVKDGVCDQRVRNKLDGEIRHFYYLESSFNELKDDTLAHRLSDEAMANASFITRDRSAQWVSSVLQQVNGNLKKEEEEKLSEDRQALHILLYVGDGGEVKLAQLIFKEPYQAVMLHDDLKATLTDLQHLRLPGVEGLATGAYFIFSVWYEK